MCFADARQSSKMYQFVLILQTLDKFEKLDLSRHEVGNFSLDALELNVITATVKFAFFLRPAHVTLLS